MTLRHTKILATLGPATFDAAAIRRLIDAGADAFRLNFAYGTRDEHADVIARVRAAADAVSRPIAVVQDLAGRKLRTGSLPEGPFMAQEGDRLTLTAGAARAPLTIAVDYERLAADLRPGDPVLLGDGEVELRVESVEGGLVRAVVERGGLVKERQGVYFPDTAIEVESLTDKDGEDARLGIALGVDFISLSFVRAAEDVAALKRLIASEGADTPVIAKLERREAIANLDAIVRAADGVMVARGDLGLQMPLPEVPLLQKQIVRQANRAGSFAITATQMMESMVTNPRPTRAEVSDVANAVLDGTDVVMLSGETAIGAYPVETVRAMARVLERVDREPRQARPEDPPQDAARAMARAAAQLAAYARAAALVVFTRSGYSAQLLAAERPMMPVVAFTPDAAIARRLVLWRGVMPYVMPWPDSAEEMLHAGESLLPRLGFARGDLVVVARWSSLGASDWTNFVHLHRLG